MAADKKKSDAKSGGKKSESKDNKGGKKTSTPAKAGNNKSGQALTGIDVMYRVPSGGQIIKFFELTPALPTASGPGDWIFSERGTTADISTLTVAFPLNPSALEREFERAVLVIGMKQNPQTAGTWRFALGGVATDHGDEDPSNDISLDIIDNGFTLLVYIHVLENSAEQIPFGFVASFTDAATGAVSIYESKDPTIQPRRP